MSATAKSKRWNVENSRTTALERTFINAAIASHNRKKKISLQKLEFTKKIETSSQ
jgi:hypothetical protein